MTTFTVSCNDCEYSGSIDRVRLHSCDIQSNGGRCEDYPCCGHTDGDGCQTLPEHTSAYYLNNPQFLHEPGSPEWYDAQDDEDDYQEWYGAQHDEDDEDDDPPNTLPSDDYDPPNSLPFEAGPFANGDGTYRMYP